MKQYTKEELQQIMEQFLQSLKDGKLEVSIGEMLEPVEQEYLEYL